MWCIATILSLVYCRTVDGGSDRINNLVICQLDKRGGSRQVAGWKYTDVEEVDECQ